MDFLLLLLSLYSCCINGYAASSAKKIVLDLNDLFPPVQSKIFIIEKPYLTINHTVNKIVLATDVFSSLPSDHSAFFFIFDLSPISHTCHRVIRSVNSWFHLWGIILLFWVSQHTSILPAVNSLTFRLMLQSVFFLTTSPLVHF